MKYCPKCGGECISLTSSSECRESEVTCDDCGYQVRRNWPEQKIETYWEALKRKPQQILIDATNQALTH